MPVTLTGFFMLGKQGHDRIAVAWLVCCSLVFYGWWNFSYLGLLLGSILFNYLFGILLNRNLSRPIRRRKFLLAIGVAANLGLLGYFKYAEFFVNEVSRFLGLDWQLAHVMLPLAISFFTFQQIAYLADAYKGKAHEYGFLHYCLFVTYFPQLIAGPIVHHKEMMPQFAKKKIFLLSYRQLSLGLTIFSIGLFKKVVLADGVANYSTPVFDGVAQGVNLTIFEAWGGALAYTLQLYFDFSGYSDMAIGLAALIGIRLPLNFFSPYKARNIIEFWRRWHMTLSRFLRDYLYIPLGGGHNGQLRRNLNFMVVMLLGGLWHGANWTFLLWGALHGFYIVINHCWQLIRDKMPGTKTDAGFFGHNFSRFGGHILTFGAVVVGWVFFRAEDIQDGFSIVGAMFGSNGVSLFPWMSELLGQNLSAVRSFGPVLFDGPFHNGLVNWYMGIGIILVLMIIVWFAPNTFEIMRDYDPVFVTYREDAGQTNGGSRTFGWKFNAFYGIVTGFLLACSLIVIGARQDISEFLYFQF